jgi:hypothetical protein
MAVFMTPVSITLALLIASVVVAMAYVVIDERA